MNALRVAAVLSLALTVSFGCKRAAENDGENNDKQAQADSPAAAKTAPNAAKVATAKTPAASEEEGSCGNKAAKGEDSCAGEMDEKAGGCNKWDAEAAEVSKRDVPKDAEWKVFAVSGMTCGGCERRVIAHIGRLDGVVAVEADAELGQVRVASAKGSQLDDTVKSSIAKLGYKVATR